MFCTNSRRCCCGAHPTLPYVWCRLLQTTAIREIARTLSDELHKRVVIVDTSNEIGGDGDVPHPAIGNARRMQVADATRQHDVMVSTATTNTHALSTCMQATWRICVPKTTAATCQYRCIWQPARNWMMCWHWPGNCIISMMMPCHCLAGIQG